MNKVYSVCVFMFLSICSVLGQVNFGIDASMGASKIRIKNPSYQPDLFSSEGGALGFSLGPSVTIGINDHWTIHTAIDFSFAPSKMQYNGDATYEVSDYFSSTSKKYNNVFAVIPVTVRYHLVDRDRTVSPYVSVGAVYNYQILEGCPSGVDCLDHTEENNLGGIFGVGFEVGKVNVGARAEIGLLNMITEEYLISKSDLKIRKDMLLIEIGYTFE